MSFNSLQFAIFLPIVFILYWLMPTKYKWVFLLTASYYFYMCLDIKYVFFLLFSTAVTYFSAIIIANCKKNSTRRGILAAGSVFVLGMLAVLKYFNFFSSSITYVLNSFELHLSPLTISLILPVGISFYTFQTLGYLIDVYRGKIPVERHFGKYALFVSFFPQIMSGPIGRAGSLIPQLDGRQHFEYDKAMYGLKLMAWGFFKKLVIADTAGTYVDMIYGNLEGYQGFTLLVTAVLYSLQIYCDFSGYTDIAIGTAKLLGIDLMTNFRSPYFSATVKEFWSRWHISLSTWLRDYLYIPLGGNRKGKLRQQLNIMITFLISGLWHGPNWTFVLWGALHGLAQIFENLVLRNSRKDSSAGSKTTSEGKEPLPTGQKPSSDRKITLHWILSVCGVFVFCTCAWVFFRADSLADAVYVFRYIFAGVSSPTKYILDAQYYLGIEKAGFFSLAAAVCLLFVYDFANRNRDVIYVISGWKKWIQGIFYIALVTAIVIAGAYGPSYSAADFIYFKF